MKSKIFKTVFVAIIVLSASSAFAQIGPGGGGGGSGGGGSPPGAGAPIDGGAVVFLLAITAYAYYQLKKVSALQMKVAKVK